MPTAPILGRLVERGFHDDHAGSGYAIIDGVDGRVHHLRFRDLDATGDTPQGGVVETRLWTGKTDGTPQLSLVGRSDLSLAAQIKADGATWLDRLHLARDRAPLSGTGFGAEVRKAMEQRADHLVAEGLARRQGQRVTFARDLLATLAAESKGEKSVDDVSRQVRSRMMASIRGKDTKPELVLRKVLHRSGFRFRLHDGRLPGRPDLVLRRWNAVIFVHGCFWHRHQGCRYATTPATREGFWQEKFTLNVARDLRNQGQLHQAGVRTGIVWDCALRKPAAAVEIVHDVCDWLRSCEGYFETGLPSIGRSRL